MSTVTPFASPASPQSARTLMVLGLLQGGPRHGYDIHRVMVAHGSLYADFKKPTLYHLLARLAEQGAVQVTSESGARGPRGERLVYAITAAGRTLFRRLLRDLLSSYDSHQSAFQMAAGFLSWIPAEEGVRLLGRRKTSIEARRAEVVAELDHLAGPVAASPMEAQRRASRFLAADHALCIMDAELAWIGKTIGRLESAPEPNRRRKPWKDASTSR